MAEVGEQTEIRETKHGVRARKRENEKGNHKRIQKKLRRKGLRKFELVDGSFQELGASMAHLVGSVSTCALSPERVEV